MLTRAVGVGGALRACLRSLSALQSSLDAQLVQHALSSAFGSPASHFAAAPAPPWRHGGSGGSLRWLSLEAAAAAAVGGDVAVLERSYPRRQQAAVVQKQQQQGAQQQGAGRQAEYRIEVVTGDVRGADSKTPAVITLIGEEGESEPYTIGRGDDDSITGFERATRQTYVLRSPRLGELRRLHVRQMVPSDPHVPGAVSGQTERMLLPMDLASLSSFEARQVVNLNPLFAPLHVTGAGVSLPHPEKVSAGLRGMNKKGYGYGGEDSYFYCSNRNGVFAMGVSDGVYAWREKGIDAGAFSQKLMEYARLAVSMGTTDVLRVLQYAAKRVQRERVKGSATCCVALVDMLQGRMASANLGDSGIMVLGPRKEDGSSEWPVYVPPGAKVPLVIKYHSPQQEHSFGRPYQLGHHEYADAAEDAMLTTMPVGPGDVLLMGSDGLYDNLGDEEIRAEVERMVHQGERPAAIAQRLTHLAFGASLDPRKDTPYSQGASEAFDMVYSGGKADDITVVCALIQ